MEKKQISEVLAKALNELETAEFEWSAEEVHLKNVTGRMVLYLKSGQSGNA